MSKLNLKSPLEVVYDELLETQDLNLLFRWIEKHGFDYEKMHLKQMYYKGFEHGKNDNFPQGDDEYYRTYPTVSDKILKS